MAAGVPTNDNTDRCCVSYVPGNDAGAGSGLNTAADPRLSRSPDREHYHPAS
jgi:hypothetical protein